MLTIELPFSKSEINRLFLIAFQADKPFLIKNFSFCDDTRVIYDFYQQLGIQMNLKAHELEIDSKHQSFQPMNLVNVHQAGTAFRFLLALCSLQPYSFYFYGHESLAKRPIKVLTDTLSQLKIDYQFESSNKSLPLRFTGLKQIIKNEIIFEQSLISSQFISSILLLAPSLPLNFKIFLNDEEVLSESYIYMTLKMLERIGLCWEYNKENKFFALNSNQLNEYQYWVSADWTNASYFIALSCILKIPILLPNLSIQSYQPDVDQLFLWTQLGVEFSTLNDIDLEVNPQNFELVPFEWDFSSTPDLFQTFAVLTAYQKGKYHFSGLQTLQYKETHRLQALKSELDKIGIQMDFDEKNGTCTIINNIKSFPRGIIFFNTYKDHRMAMALSLLKPLLLNIEFEDIQVVSKSFPNYWNEFDKFFDYYK